VQELISNELTHNKSIQTDETEPIPIENSSSNFYSEKVNFIILV